MDATFLQARIDATKAMILAYETAIDAITVGGVSSYTLDTGQTTQTVTKLNLPALQRTLASLDNRCATYEARLKGTGTVTGAPAW